MPYEYNHNLGMMIPSLQERVQEWILNNEPDGVLCELGDALNKQSAVKSKDDKSAGKFREALAQALYRRDAVAVGNLILKAMDQHLDIVTEDELAEYSMYYNVD